MTWFKDTITDDAGQYDIGFILWLVGGVVFLGLACANWQRFDAQQYGIGFGAVLAAGGAMSWLRTPK